MSLGKYLVWKFFMIKSSGDKRCIFDFVMISAALPLKRDIHYRGHF